MNLPRRFSETSSERRLRASGRIFWGIAVLHAARARQPPFALAPLSAILDFWRGFLEPETA